MLAYTSKAELEFYVIETEMKNAEVGLKQKCKAWSVNLNFNTFWNKNSNLKTMMTESLKLTQCVYLQAHYINPQEPVQSYSSQTQRVRLL